MSFCSKTGRRNLLTPLCYSSFPRKKVPQDLMMELALHLLLLDPLDSCSSILSNLVIQVPVEKQKAFSVSLVSSPNLPGGKPLILSPQLKPSMWISENSHWVFCWQSSLTQQRNFVVQHPDASSSHPSHPLLSLFVHFQHNCMPGGR